ncbi:MAG: hypothetical protein NTW86_06290 [Candidatus Sumerlaeota bacterium]|nr:hypothetical protein [Candidatus Sumerlaeota bacterium]
MSAFTVNLYVAVCGFILVAVGVFCAMSAFWPLPSARLRGTAAAAGIAVVNSVGNLGGFVGPYIIGYVRDTRLGFAGGLCVTGLFLAIGAALVVVAKRQESARATYRPGA